MQNTSDLYKEILMVEHRKECRLGIDVKNAPINGIRNWYGEDMLISMSTALRLFSEDTPSVGNCVAGEINIEMLKPGATIPRQAVLVPQIRITDGKRYSEWISKGRYYVDTRSVSGEGTKTERLTLHGYDDMLKAEQDYPGSLADWPRPDIHVVEEIVAFLGVEIDPRTREIMTKQYEVQYPSDMNCRDTLGYIAAMYGGSFIMNDIGQLRLVQLNDLPPETNFLVTEGYDAIVFGGDRILV